MRKVMFAALLLAAEAQAQETVVANAAGDSVTLRFVDTELRSVIQAIGRYLNKPVMVTGLPGIRVTLETPRPYARSELRGLMEGLAATNQLEFVEEASHYRVTQRSLQPPTRQNTAVGDRQLFVRRLRHAKAADVANVLNQLFGGSGEFTATPGAINSGALSTELRRNVEPAISSAGQTVRASRAELSGNVVVIPDNLTNSLLIRGTQADYEVMNAAVEEMDIRPLQVLIRVLIVELRRDRSLSLGTDIHSPPHKLGASDATLEGTLTGGGQPGVLELEIMKWGPLQLDATIRAAQSRGDARIVSRPVILASNGQSARILVGSQRPFVQVSRSLPTDVPSRDQVVQYKNVGTELTVVPTINADGFVSMDILQEVSSATSETQFNAPVISTREASTRALVRDSQTVVIGGLRDEQHDVTRGGIPILSSIPWIGALFGSEDRRNSGTELFLFITPIILRDDETAARATSEALRDSERAVPLKHVPKQ